MLEIRGKHKNYGVLRMTNELRDRGFPIIQRLIKKLRIKVTAYTRKSRRIQLNLDILDTIRQKKLYLDPFMDMFNREVLSYRISEKPNALAIMKGLEEAIQTTNDCP